MTPRDLFKKLRSRHRALVGPLCRLHSLCQSTDCCALPVTTPVINFDKIKEIYCRKKGIIHMPPSVDAITISRSGNTFCFVELKSWVKYLVYSKDVTADTIDRQVKRYHFREKLQASMEICTEMSDPDFFAVNDFAYLIVTDAEAELRIDAARSFAMTMFSLAETSSRRWRPECIAATDRAISKFRGINVRHISCQDFDKVLSTL